MRLVIAVLAILAAIACEVEPTANAPPTSTPTPVSPRQIWAGNAVYGRSIKEYPVTEEEVAAVCRDLLRTERTITALERLVWDVFDWKQIAILGAIYSGMAEDECSITTYCRDKEVLAGA